MSLAELFFARQQARRAHHLRSHRRRPRPRRRLVHFEALESRLLLAGDPLTYAAAGLALDITLHVDRDADGTEVLELVDRAAPDGPVVVRQALAETSEVVIVGSDGADTLRVDLDPSFVVPVSFTDHSRGDGDSLHVRGEDTAWTITGPDAGAAGVVTFAGAENLFGAEDNRDTFVFDLARGASLSGRLDGGAGGYDSIALVGGSYQTVLYAASGIDAGFIDLDGTRISYAGLEPIVDGTATVARVVTGTSGADTITVTSLGTGEIVVSSDTFETITFAAPSGSLTIGAEGGDDHVIIEHLDLDAVLVVGGGDGADEISVTGSVSLPAHDLALDAETISVEAGAAISTSDGATRGSITFTAAATGEGVLGLPGLTSADASAAIVVDGATIVGGDIALTASATATAADALGDFAWLDVHATASVTVNASSIQAAGTLSLSSVSSASATAQGARRAPPRNRWMRRSRSRSSTARPPPR